MRIHLSPNRQFIVAIICALSISACGGGSSSESPNVAGATAEGVYAGSINGGASTAFQLLVLENGDFWSLYGTQTANSFIVAGFVQGSGVSNNGTFTSTNSRDFGLTPALAVNTNATYNPTLKAISGTLSAGGNSVTFNGGPIQGSPYDYNLPASLATASSLLNTTSLSGENVAINVAANGAFAA